jgi:hypothetical protein
MNFRQLLAKAVNDYGISSYEARRFVYEQMAGLEDRLRQVEAALGIVSPDFSGSEAPHLYPIMEVLTETDESKKTPTPST